MLVIGASGYLGAEILRQAGEGALGTYARHSTSSCLRYNFFADSLEPILGKVENGAPVVFAAAVERAQTNSAYFYHALDRFLGELIRSQRRFIYISSDAVFSGLRGQYSESDLPDADTLYGRHLRRFEQEVTLNHSNSLVVRVSYMYGDTESHADRRVAEAREVLESGRTFYRYDNIYKSPVRVVDAARFITRLARSDKTGVLHISGPRMSIYEFYTQECACLGEQAHGIEARVGACELGEGPDTSLINNDESASVFRSLA